MIKQIMAACLTFKYRFYTLSMIVELVKDTEMDRQDVRHKLWKLENAGLITRIKCWETPLPGFSKGRPTKEICYTNTKKLKVKAEAPPAMPQCGWDKMWKAVRVLRQFTHGDLVTICEQDINNVRYFVKRYRDAGYFRAAGKNGREIRWMLTKNLGPKRPIITRETNNVD